MVSVSDILARVMDSPDGNRPAVQSNVGGQSGSSGLLTFIQQFAEPIAAPAAPLAVPERTLTHPGQPVDQVAGLAPQETSEPDGLSGLAAPDMLFAATNDSGYLQTIFDPAFIGINLPVDGEALPDEAAIVATLLGRQSAAPVMPADLAAAEVGGLSAALSTELSTSEVLGAMPGVHQEPTVVSSETATAAINSTTAVGSSVVTVGTERSAASDPLQPALIRQTGTMPGTTDLPSSGPEGGEGDDGAEGYHWKQELIRDPRPVATATMAGRDSIATLGSAPAVPSSVTSAAVNATSDLALPLTSASSASLPWANAASVSSGTPPAVLTSAAGEEARQMSLLLSGEGRDRALAQERWADGVGRQLLLMQRDGLSTARMRLDPPSLGTLSIQIQMTDQGASVSFVAQHAAVRDALEQHTARLHELFQEQELNLLDVSVSDQDARERPPRPHGSDENGQDRSGPSETDDEIIASRSQHLIDERV